MDSKKIKTKTQTKKRKKTGITMIQFDGSEHDWFEGRAPHCTLLVLIDDARAK